MYGDLDVFWLIVKMIGYVVCVITFLPHTYSSTISEELRWDLKEKQLNKIYSWNKTENSTK